MDDPISDENSSIIGVVNCVVILYRNRLFFFEIPAVLLQVLITLVLAGISLNRAINCSSLSLLPNSVIFIVVPYKCLYKNLTSFEQALKIAPALILDPYQPRNDLSLIDLSAKDCCFVGKLSSSSTLIETS